MADLTFDLLVEPWIEVVDRDGRAQFVGLRQALLHAHEWRRVVDADPLVECGLLRLLVAVFADVHRLDTLEQLLERAEAGTVDSAAVGEYFERFGSRFDLFHPATPFLQSRDLLRDEKPKPLAGMVPYVPSGTNVSHWHHEGEARFRVSPAAAARLLVTVPCFMTAGGAGLSPSINGAPPWYIVLEGRSLFESIVLNTWVDRITDLDPDPVALGEPTWRRVRDVGAGVRVTERPTYLEALTWTPRRVRLLPGEPGVCALTGENTGITVSEMRFAAGDACGFEWRDPQVAYRPGKDGLYVLRPAEERAPWRDTEAFFLASGSRRETLTAQRPRIVEQWLRMADEAPSLRTQTLSATAYALRTDGKMKVFEWLRDELRFERALIVGETFHARVTMALHEGESGAGELERAVRRLAPRDGSGGAGKGRQLMALRQYWDGLHNAFTTHVRALAALDPADVQALDSAAATWRTAVRREALAAFDLASDGLRRDAATLERVSIARSHLARSLAMLGAPPTGTATAGARRGRRSSSTLPQP
jgi:CRISPR system Cascade subunit CasA